MSLTLEQRRARQSCIGGSDFASILGLPGAYNTPLEVWKSKVEPVADEESTYAQERGDALEPFVVRWFGRETGKQVQTDKWVDEHLPFAEVVPEWWKCQLDAVVHEDGRVVPLEAKTATVFKRGEWGESGSDQVPLRYVVQVMAQIAYMNAPYGYLAVDIGGDEFRWYKIMRDDALIAHMLKAGAEFWSLVKNRIPPAPSTSSEANIVWKRHEPGEFLQADVRVFDILTEIVKARTIEKVAAAAREAAELQLKAALEHCEGVKDGDRVLCTWKTQESKRVDTTALKKEQPALAAKYTTTTTTRVLRVKGGSDE